MEFSQSIKDERVTVWTMRARKFPNNYSDFIFGFQTYVYKFRYVSFMAISLSESWDNISTDYENMNI